MTKVQVHPSTAAHLAKIEVDMTDTARLAEQMLDQARGDVAAATALLEVKLASDAALREQVLPEMLHLWARQEISQYQARQRRAIIASVAPGSGTAFNAALNTAISNEAQSLLDLPIWGGKALRYATPEEVRESALRYGLIASDASRKARWFDAVAAAARAVKPDAPIGETLDEARLAALWDEADAR